MLELKNVSLTREVKNNREEVTFIEMIEPIVKMYLPDLKSKVSYDNSRTWNTEKLKEIFLVEPYFNENGILASKSYLNKVVSFKESGPE